MVTAEQAAANPSEYLGRDIILDVETGDLRINSRDDLQQVRYDDNLKQAIRLRLATAKGSLALHAEYGSRLHELLGVTPSPDVLLLARAHVKDALLQEPRIDRIIKLKAAYRDSLKNIIDIQLEVQPIEDLDPLNMVYSTFI
jgi:phage baseplate assembly protein W